MKELRLISKLEDRLEDISDLHKNKLVQCMDMAFYRMMHYDQMAIKYEKKDNIAGICDSKYYTSKYQDILNRIVEEVHKRDYDIMTVRDIYLSGGIKE